MAPAFTDATTGGFDHLYGLELVEVGEGCARGQVAVRDELLQPLGVVRGAVLAAIAETITAIATRQAIAGDGRTASALSSQMSFLRPIAEGTIHARAIAKHRGRTTWVWEVELADDQDRLSALARITLALSEPSGG